MTVHRAPFSAGNRHCVGRAPVALRPFRSGCACSAGNDDKDLPTPPPIDDPEAAQEPASLQLPREVINRLKDTVFGFDTFFVTSTENYEADGVIFKGNLRGDPDVAFEKMERRLRTELGDDYKVFLLSDQEEKPVVVVLPTSAIEGLEGAVPMAPVAALFAAVTLVTTLQACGVPFLGNFVGLDVGDPLSPEYLLRALPGTIATFAILAAHELGHKRVADAEGVSLAPPFLIPAGLGIIGSFGAVTGITGTVRDRGALLRIAAGGPAAGTAASAALVFLGLGLSAAGAGPLFSVQTAAFNDCLVMGVLGQLTFGSDLYLQPEVALSPLLLAGWAGLVVNGLNTIPMGELDGGRIAHAIWGRRAASRVTVVLTLVLGLAAIVDSLALYWILLILTLQRGPIKPQQNEVSAAGGGRDLYLSLGLLALPLLTLIPYPVDVTQQPGF